MKIKLGKYNLVFTLVISSITILLLFLPTGFENPGFTKNSYREKCEIIEIDNSDLATKGIIPVGTQFLKMKVLRGKFAGDTIKGKNILLGQLSTDVVFREGDKVLAIIRVNGKTGEIVSARADDLYRVDLTLILFGLFALFLIGFARWTGFKALLSFVFTALAIWKILIPLFLKGYNPVALSFAIVALVTAVIILLISGFNKKGLTALSGSITGVGLTAALALIFGELFRLPGTIQQFSEAVLFAGFIDLKLSDIFISAIFISAAGAVMDVAMDIAAAQNEIIEKMPDISTKELIKSGFNISYPVIGTMTTTLLFAYSGSFMFVFMAFMAKGTPIISIFNKNFIAAEILHTLVGTFGLALVAPATAIIGGYIYTKK